MKKKKRILTIAILFSVVLAIVVGRILMPVSAWHVFHLLVAPKGLYDPIVIDRFPFDKKAFAKTYELNPKYFDYYHLSIQFLNEDVSSKYRFSGKLLVEFLYKNKLISTKTINKQIAAWYVKNDISRYRKISLLRFEIPIEHKYSKNLSIRVTVLEVDEELKKYRESTMLNIAVSAIP